MRIKHLVLVLVAFLLLSSVPVYAAGGNVWKEFYVAVGGNDENPGTKDSQVFIVK